MNRVAERKGEIIRYDMAGNICMFSLHCPLLRSLSTLCHRPYHNPQFHIAREGERERRVGDVCIVVGGSGLCGWLCLRACERKCAGIPLSVKKLQGVGTESSFYYEKEGKIKENRKSFFK